jgi:peptide/nickel transport system substrate-binding protein
MLTKRQLKAMFAGALLATAAVAAFAQDPGKVLRMVPQSDLKILDPIWTTAFVTRNHGYMVYDTLFGVDEQGKVQAADGRQVHRQRRRTRPGPSRCARAWPFMTASPSPRGRHCVARSAGAKRDGLGQKMFDRAGQAEAVDANTFQHDLQGQPFGMVLDALGKPSSPVPFIMPSARGRHARRQADRRRPAPAPTSSRRRIPPRREDRLPEEHQVRAAQGGPSGTAGGKNVYVDRVEWIVLKDAQTQANALLNGEVDMIEWVPSEQYTALKNNPAITIDSRRARGLVRAAPEPLHCRPSTTRRSLQAAFMAINQEALMRAQLVHKDSTTAAPPSTRAARPMRATRPATSPASRSSRKPRRCSRKPATTASPWC